MKSMHIQKTLHLPSFQTKAVKALTITDERETLLDTHLAYDEYEDTDYPEVYSDMGSWIQLAVGMILVIFMFVSRF